MRKLKFNKRGIIFSAIAIFSSIAVSTFALANNYNFRNYYRSTNCAECNWKLFDDSQKDSEGNSRQYGIKLCEKHKKEMAEESEFIEHGFTDYNCMAYAVGETGPCSWMWPASWGAAPKAPKVKQYFEENGYTTEDYDPSKIKEYKEKDAIFVYGVKYGPLSIIQHFGRANALNGIDIGDNATASKWGSYAIYETKDVNCYKGSSGYGECSFVCYKK